MGLGEGSSDFGDSIEKHHQEKCLRARAEAAKRHRQGLAMTGREYLPVDVSYLGKGNF